MQRGQQTTFYLEKEIREELDTICDEMDLPRSRLMQKAVAEFIAKHRGRPFADRTQETRALYDAEG